MFTQEEPTTYSVLESRLKSSVILRMVIVAVLTIILLIPTIFVDFLISDRSRTRETAMASISNGWGSAQTIAGPILSIPYRQQTKDAIGNDISTVRILNILPQRLLMKGSLKAEIRSRGIYRAALYQSDINVSGRFHLSIPDEYHIPSQNVNWDEAFLTIGITDMGGLRDTAGLEWNNKTYSSEPGVRSEDVVSSGVTFRPHISPSDTDCEFSFPLRLNGSSGLSFIPVGDVTDVILDAPWGDPSFTGSFIPQMRNVTDSSFHAEWRVLHLNRNYPKGWSGDRYKIASSAFGVGLYLAVDEYQQISRTVKYALLFIVLTFAAFFLAEISTGMAFHPIQYALVGFALVLFYVLLLSISEHIRFDIAYGIASLAVISLCSLYTFWIAAKKQLSIVIALVLTALYLFLFVTVQLQDYALLMGSIGLFAVLSAIMFLTRKIDWFSISQRNPSRQQTPV
jgi:inner membrane protein